MANPLTDLLDPKVRKPLYLSYALVGVGIGATQVGFSAADSGQPTWLTVALAVYAFLGTAFGFTAAANVPSVADVVAGDVTPAEIEQVRRDVTPL